MMFKKVFTKNGFNDIAKLRWLGVSPRCKRATFITHNDGTQELEALFNRDQRGKRLRKNKKEKRELTYRKYPLRDLVVTGTDELSEYSPFNRFAPYILYTVVLKEWDIAIARFGQRFHNIQPTFTIFGCNFDKHTPTSFKFEIAFEEHVMGVIKLEKNRISIKQNPATHS